MTEIADKTARYVADFEAFARNGASGAPAWLRELRQGAIARFSELGFPTTKQEEWRFTSVAPIADARFTLQHAARSPLPGHADIERLCVGAGPRVVFVDGRHVPALSTPAELTGGARAGSLAAALRTGTDSELARTHLARHARWGVRACSRTCDRRSAAGGGLPLDRPIGIRRTDRLSPAQPHRDRAGRAGRCRRDVRRSVGRRVLDQRGHGGRGGGGRAGRAVPCPAGGLPRLPRGNDTFATGTRQLLGSACGNAGGGARPT